MRVTYRNRVIFKFKDDCLCSSQSCFSRSFKDLHTIGINIFKTAITMALVFAPFVCHMYLTNSYVAYIKRKLKITIRNAVTILCCKVMVLIEEYCIKK